MSDGELGRDVGRDRERGETGAMERDRTAEGEKRERDRVRKREGDREGEKVERVIVVKIRVEEIRS